MNDELAPRSCLFIVHREQDRPQPAAAEGERDGEIVALDRNGLPSFQELQNWQSTHAPIVFYVFDLLQVEDRELRRLPIEERMEVLSGLRLTDPIRLSETLDAPLAVFVPQMKKLGLEGLIAKRRGSIYLPGERPRSWLKQRFNQVGEFVIGGYLPEGRDDARRDLGQAAAQRRSRVC